MDHLLLYITCLISLLSVTRAEETKPELITTENNDYFGFMDEFRGFKCQAKGTNLKYSWKHNDITIDDKYILKFPKTNASTLQPLQENIDITYQGFYQCFVENSIGTIFGRRALVEFTIVGDFIEQDETKVVYMDVEVDKPYALHCPAHRTSKKVSYGWYYRKAGKLKDFPENNNSFVSNNGTLYFSILRNEEINYVNDNEGILCQQVGYVKGSATVAKNSHLIKFRAKASSGGTKIKVRPTIRTSFTDKTIDLKSKSLVLHCGATGYPIPTLKWFRIDSITSAEPEIVEGTDFKFDTWNQFLTIRNVNGGDKSGKYKCEAKNSEGKDSKSGKVTVAEYPQWMPNGDIRDVEPPLYSRLEWRCGAFGGASYNWYKNGVVISQTSPDGKVSVVTRNSQAYLIIKNVTATFNGMYQCTASNELDVIYSTARLKIIEKKPVFTEKMGPVTLILGREGIIYCPVEGSPTPRITWRKDGAVIYKVGQNNAKKYKLRDEKHLIITNVTLDDKGTYTCDAENRNGNDKDTSVVTVGRDIYWISAPVSNRNVTVTLRYELDCEAGGDPSYNIKYRWLRNGLPLEYSARIHWVKEAHKLVILDAIVDDTGLYSCIASAETPLYIEKRKDVDIVVKAPANPPDLVWVVGSCWDDGQQKERAALNWKVGSLNNEDVYEYWIDWSTTYDPTNWTRLPTVLEDVQRPIQLNFNLLPPFSQISFRVTVFNRIGAGEPSIPTDPSDCITKPAAPRFSPVEIKGVPGGPNTLTIEWTPVPQTWWGGPGFNYSVQWRRKTYDALGRSENRWLNLPREQDIRILDGNNNSVPVKNPGYYVEWEFRIRSNNAKGSAPTWRYGSSFSGQDHPETAPSNLSPDRITARSADISWAKVTAPKNGTISGYKVQYWHSGIGMDVEYEKNGNLSHIDLETINEIEEAHAERYREKRSIEKRDVEERSKRDTDKQISLTKKDIKASIVERYLSKLQRSVSKRDTEAQNVPRIRKKREDEDENVEKEEPLDLCFNPDEPCYQDAPEKESQLSQLTPYKTYHIRVAAYNSGGLGPWSDETIFNTAEAPPGQPYAVNTIAYDKFCKLTWKEPRHKNGEILQYEVYGKGIVRTQLPWWMRRHIIYDLNPGVKYEAKLRARTSAGWGVPVFRWFQTHDKASKPAKPLLPEVVGYGEDGVNVTFMEPEPETERKFGGEMDEDPWELRPVGGYELEKRGKGGYPAEFYVIYRRKGSDVIQRTGKKRMYDPYDQTWIVIENLEKDTVYEFATVPVNSEGPGPQSDWAIGLTGGIVPKVAKLYWYQRDWFVALIIVFSAALLLFFVVFCTTFHLKSIYYEGAPKRRKDRERERIYEPEDVDGGFSEFTLKSARSSRSVVTSRSEAPPAYNSVVGSASRHSGDFDEDEDSTDSEDEKHEVSTYYSDEKKIPLDDLDDDDEEESALATFV